ncbi:MAG: hypothetical protein ACLFPV_08890 [Spirochaetaceae bacterium]
MRRLSVFLTSALIALSGCTADLVSFGLNVDDRLLPLTEEPGRRRAEEGVVPPAFDEGEGYQIRLEVSGEEADLPVDRYLKVSYAGDASGAYLEVLPAGPETTVPGRIAFPPGSASAAGASGETELVVPLTDSRAFEGLRIGRDAEGSEFTLTGVALVEPWRGVSFAGERLVLTAGSRVSRDVELQAWGIELPPRPESGAHLVVAYTADPAAFEEFDGEPVTAGVELSDEAGNRRVFTLRLRPGERRVQLYPWVVGFSPGQLRFLSRGSPARLDEVVWVAPSEGQAVTAELGTVLDYRPETLQEDYTLFRWSLYPDVLLMDFASYRVQSSYLKRLAFFVEKRGFRGRVASFAELADRHGWNAHNYAPEGLAGFFSAASDISPEEEALKLLALEEGIILRAEEPAGGTSDDDYLAGAGGILSVSQESNPILRRLLLTHEATHGVFYSEPAFVDAVWEVWNAQSPEFRDAWRLFLSSMTYDPADEYLMVNEFQAYLLQQPIENLGPYLNSRIVPRIRGRYSDAFLSRFVQDSLEAGRLVNEALFRTTGFLGGDVLCLVPADG